MSGKFGRLLYLDDPSGRQALCSGYEQITSVLIYELEKAGTQVSWEWKDYIYFMGVL